jgi:type VI secretion system secreted protein VgrG
MSRLGPVTITPLLGRKLFFRTLSGDEIIGGLFEYNVQFLSDDPNIKLAEALGQSLTITIPLTLGGVRHFNGFITRFSRIGLHGTRFLYRAVLHPWLWFLSRTSDCRIFQNQNVPDVVNRIFLKYPIHFVDPMLSSYDPREYLVQYRETDLNFVNRLLEQEGIAYHFVHAADKHTMVLTDSLNGRLEAVGYKTIPLHPPTETGQEECFTSWNVSQEVEPAAYALDDYDYLKASAPLAAALPSTATADFHFDGEIYDAPGKYKTADEGNKLVATRLHQAQSYYETIDAQGTVRGIGVGNVFMLDGLLSLEGQRQFLVVKARYEIHGHAPESQGDDGKDESFHCSITAVDAKIPFHPPRVTPTPVVQGPQTATVVGPHKNVKPESGQSEICTDNLGRVRVNFHWERLGKLKPKDPGRSDDDEKSDNDKAPCWLRVAQLWAGSGWGTVFIPRIGQEVLVEFLEGDPDRPIVTGRLYNSDQKPAYLGEGKITQSGIRSRSTPDGGVKNFNEIRFEDKKGAEEVYIQAEKNQVNHVKHNRSADVGADDSITAGGNRSVHVKGNLAVTVDGGGGGEFHSTHKVSGSYHYEATDKIYIEAPNEIRLKCGSSTIVMVPGSITLTAGDKAILKLDAAVTAESADHSQLKLDADAQLTASTGAGLLLTADVTASSKDGSELQLDKNALLGSSANVDLNGKNTTVTGTTKAVVDGGGATVTAQGSGVDVVGTAIKLNG